MAIAAAHADDRWSFSSHGLHLVDREAEFTDMLVRPEGAGGFQKVAAATGSPGITGLVSLGALWASLPDLSQAGPLPGSASPVPLELLSEESTATRPQATLYLPGDHLPRDLPPGQPAWLTRFGEIMAAYPTAANPAIPDEPDAVQTPDTAGPKWAVTLRWPAMDASGDMSEEELRAFFDKIAPEYRYRGDRFLRPAIEPDSSPPPSPLMTWWLLLYAFSILARYTPRRWAQLLDLDNPGAALLQYALEEALTAVPQLVLEALDGEAHPLPKPLSF
jgi:hypothetical protein